MKRIVSLLLCLMVVLSFSACGKKNESTSDKGTVAEQKADGGHQTKEEKSSDNKADNAKSDNETSSEVKQLPVESAERLESMVDEFNSTDDPERKEELRKQLEEILNQAEQLTTQD